MSCRPFILPTSLVVLLPLLTRGYRLGSNSIFNDSPTAGLNIFAATFNAGNERFQDAEGTVAKFDHLAETVLSGHEGPGGADAADIVFLGIQEMEDRSLGFGNRMREQMLWKNLSASKRQALKSEVERHSSAPGSIVDAKRAIEENLASYFAGLEAEIDRFDKSFGAGAHDFHDHLAMTSSTQHLLGKPRLEDLGQWKSELGKPLTEYKSGVNTGLEVQFANLTTAVGSLKQFADSSFPSDGIHGNLKPISDWVGQVKGEMVKSRKAYPNLMVNSEGHDAWRRSLDEFTGAYQGVSLALGHAELKNRQLALGKYIDNFEKRVSSAVQDAQDSVSQQLQADIENLESAMTKLEGDLKAQPTQEQFKQSIKKAASESGKPILQALREELAAWKANIDSAMGKLLRPAGLGMKDEHVEVQLHPQEYRSSTTCGWVSHYDTFMYVYVNPWSGWEVKPKPYSSKKCEVDKGHGCNIDNIKGKECGKVVNFMVLEARKGATSLKVCALNTHMSYKGEAEDRMEILSGVMEETIKAGCDTVVFAGDFNSRLHCDKSGPNADMPFFSASLDGVLDEFCPSGDECKLLNGRAYFDEMHQMLSQEEILCWEEREKKSEGSWFGGKKEWQVISRSNMLKPYGLQEAASPNWAPTFKLDKKMACTPGETCPQVCLPFEPTCFTNKDGKFKHNPAWTDRILIKADPSKAALNTEEYSRRPISSEYGSDHIPVVAKITVRETGYRI